MSRPRFYRRRFLNRRGHHAGAYVLAECLVERSDPGVEPAQTWVTAYITIADCSRVTTLDFDVANEAESRNALHKARLLRDSVTEFVDALEMAVNEWGRLTR